MPEVLWSPLAVQQLREAADYIGRDKRRTAERWARAVFERVGLLRAVSYSGRVVPELDRAQIRAVIHGAYRIIYRVSPEQVLVLTVRHGGQLFDETEVGGQDSS